MAEAMHAAAAVGDDTQRSSEMRRRYRRALRAVPEPEEAEYLNITAMMDLMTIILVFFLKSLGTSSETNVTPPDMVVPKSTTKLPARQGVAITVTSSGVLVESRLVTHVREGRVDPAAKRDGAPGYFITGLYDALSKHKERLEEIARRSGATEPFRGEITVTCDGRTPYRLLSEVLYTAGQSGFRYYRLLVNKKGEES